MKYQNQVKKYLRTKGFSVTHSANCLMFNNYTLVFDENLDYVSIYNPFTAQYKFKFCVPYSDPEKLVQKMKEKFDVVIPRDYQRYCKLET